MQKLYILPIVLSITICLNALDDIADLSENEIKLIYKNKEELYVYIDNQILDIFKNISSDSENIKELKEHLNLNKIVSYDYLIESIDQAIDYYTNLEDNQNISKLKELKDNLNLDLENSTPIKGNYKKINNLIVKRKLYASCLNVLNNALIDGELRTVGDVEFNKNLKVDQNISANNLTVNKDVKATKLSAQYANIETIKSKNISSDNAKILNLSVIDNLILSDKVVTQITDYIKVTPISSCNLISENSCSISASKGFTINNNNVGNHGLHGLSLANNQGFATISPGEISSESKNAAPGSGGKATATGFSVADVSGGSLTGDSSGSFGGFGGTVAANNSSHAISYGGNVTKSQNSTAGHGGVSAANNFATATSYGGDANSHNSIAGSGGKASANNQSINVIALGGTVLENSDGATAGSGGIAGASNFATAEASGGYIENSPSSTSGSGGKASANNLGASIAIGGSISGGSNFIGGSGGRAYVNYQATANASAGDVSSDSNNSYSSSGPGGVASANNFASSISYGGNIENSDNSIASVGGVASANNSGTSTSKGGSISGGSNLIGGSGGKSRVNYQATADASGGDILPSSTNSSSGSGGVASANNFANSRAHGGHIENSDSSIGGVGGMASSNNFATATAHGGSISGGSNFTGGNGGIAYANNYGTADSRGQSFSNDVKSSNTSPVTGKHGGIAIADGPGATATTQAGICIVSSSGSSLSGTTVDGQITVLASDIANLSGAYLNLGHHDTNTTITAGGSNTSAINIGTEIPSGSRIQVGSGNGDTTKLKSVAITAGGSNTSTINIGTENTTSSSTITIGNTTTDSAPTIYLNGCVYVNGSLLSPSPAGSSCSLNSTPTFLAKKSFEGNCQTCKSFVNEAIVGKINFTNPEFNLTFNENGELEGDFNLEVDNDFILNPVGKVSGYKFDKKGLFKLNLICSCDIQEFTFSNNSLVLANYLEDPKKAILKLTKNKKESTILNSSISAAYVDEGKLNIVLSLLIYNKNSKKLKEAINELFKDSYISFM